MKDTLRDVIRRNCAACPHSRACFPCVFAKWRPHNLPECDETLPYRKHFDEDIFIAIDEKMEE